MAVAGMWGRVMNVWSLLLLLLLGATHVLSAMLPPRLSTPRGNVKLTEGQERFVLECRLDVGDDPVTYRWLKDHRIVTGALGYAYRGYNTVFLALHKVERQHAGTYVCEASNEAGLHSAAIQVTVEPLDHLPDYDAELPHTDDILSDIATSLSDVLAEGDCSCDTMFFIHVSTDAPKETVNAQANLVHTIADQIISKTNRVSVVTYSDYIGRKLSFGEGTNRCAIREAFSDLSHEKWTTRLEPVLREAFKVFRKSKATCKVLFLPIFGSLGAEGADVLGSQHLKKVGVKLFILEVTPKPLKDVRKMASQRGDGQPYHWRVPLKIWPTIVMNMKYMAEEVVGCMPQEEDIPDKCVGLDSRCTNDSMCRGIGFACENGHCVYRECNVNPGRKPGCCSSDSPINSFWCGDVTGQCTARNSICDGRVQCMNGVDEARCWSTPCPEDKIARCQTSTLCLDLMDLCDGEPACPGGEDEDPRFCRSFPCPRDRSFRCRNGKCIAKESLCDGVFKDCIEGEDENLEFCKNVHLCPPSRPFKCDYGICIAERMLCDGTYNCLDATDELVCDKKNCPADRPFKCLSGLCISMDQVCNGVGDGCEDGSDEHNCTEIRCPPNRNFKCNSGRCIDGWLRCDGQDDCGDGTDESNCPPITTTSLPEVPKVPKMPTVPTCPRNKFQCNNGACIPENRVCDGRNNCLDGEDEIDCHTRKCPPGRKHRCKDGSCVVSSAPCNNIKECADGSDEINCTHLEPEDTVDNNYEDYEDEIEMEGPFPTSTITTTTTTTTTSATTTFTSTITTMPKEEMEGTLTEHDTHPEMEKEEKKNKKKKKKKVEEEEEEEGTFVEGAVAEAPEDVEDTHLETYVEDESEYKEDADAVETMMESEDGGESAASSEQGVDTGTCTAPICTLIMASVFILMFCNIWTR